MDGGRAQLEHVVRLLACDASDIVAHNTLFPWFLRSSEQTTKTRLELGDKRELMASLDINVQEAKRMADGQYFRRD